MRPDKAAEAIEQGRLWRAKEVLSGRIGSCPYDPDLYERYGALLLRLGDELEAGKYLLLSGRRRPGYAKAIALALSRYRGSPGNLLAAFPAAVRRSRWGALPEQVRLDLEAAGVPPLTSEDVIAAVPRDQRDSGIGCVGAIAILLLLVLIGFTIAVYVVHFKLGT